MDQIRDLEKEPFPVIFNLSSWSDKYSNFGEWLIATLFTENQKKLPFKIAETLVRQGKIIPLLDGLDELARNESVEVAQVKRANCLASLNNYLRRERKVVITCRRDEFNEMRDQTGQDAPVRITVDICDLDDSDVWSELEKAQKEEDLERRTAAANILRNIQTSKSLLEVLRNPFYFMAALEVFDKTFNRGKWDEGKFPTTKDTIEKHLVQRLVEIKLGSPPRLSRNSEGHPSTLKITFRDSGLREKNATKWLKWLAKLMERKNLDSFELRELQPPDLVNEKRYRLVASILSGILVGLIYGLLIGILLGPIAFVIGTLAISLIVALINYFGTGIGGSIFEEHKIETNEIMKLDFRKLVAWKTWVSALGWSLLGGVLGFVLSFKFRFLGMKNGFLLGLIFAMLASLFLEVRSVSAFPIIRSPYQRLTSSFVWKWLGWMVVMASLFVVFSFLDGRKTEIFGILFIMLPFLLVETLFFTPLMKHIVVRICLYLEDSMPLKCVSFLDDNAEVGILEKDGGRWLFRHKILLEYFARIDIRS